MAMSETDRIILTPEQYRALQLPVVPIPSPQQLLDFQVETLVVKGLATYAQADLLRRMLPQGLFLFVPPRPAPIDLAELMAKVEFRGVAGRNYLDADSLSDAIEVPAGRPYLAVEIEDGYGRRNVAPSANCRAIASDGRSPYVWFEGIVHGIVFPEVFETHFLDLGGSRCRSEGVPYLRVSVGRPRLDARWSDSANPGFGMPSCGRRLVGS